MAIQIILRDSGQRSVIESSFWVEFRKIFNFINDGEWTMNPATAQQLIELLMVIRHQFVEVTVVSIHYGCSYSVLKISTRMIHS